MLKDVRIAEQQKVGREDGIKQFSIQLPYISSFIMQHGERCQ